MPAMHDASHTPMDDTGQPSDDDGGRESNANICPVCGARLLHEKCKLVCRSQTCVYRIIFNCAEF